MDILMISHNRIDRGTFTRSFNFAREMVKTGHSVSIVATQLTDKMRSSEYEIEGVKVFGSPDLFSNSWRAGWDVWDVINRINYLKNRKFDIIHAFESRPTVVYPAIYQRSKQTIPLIFDWADWFGAGGSVEERIKPIFKTFYRPIETYYEEHFRKKSSAISAICSVLKEKAIALGIPEDRVMIIPNGCDINKFYPENGTEYRNKQRIPAQALIIGYVGSIFPKDAQLLSDAYEEVLKYNPEVWLVTIGRSGKSIRDRIKHNSKYLDLGYIPDTEINAYFNLCDLFWLPLSDIGANQGRWSLKFNDIIAAGKPIVSTNVGDTAGIICQEKIGVVSGPIPSGIAQNTIDLFNNCNERIEMGKRARNLAERKFRWDEFGKQLTGFYKYIIDNKNTRQI